MIRYLLASGKEIRSFKNAWGSKEPNGSIEVIDGSKRYSKEDVLVYIGYASGHKIPVGSIIEPVYVVNGCTNEVARTDSIFPVEHRVCFTCEKIPDKPIEDIPSIYDTELFNGVSRKGRRIHSLKIVSDNLDETQREKYNGKESWIRVVDILQQYLTD